MKQGTTEIANSIAVIIEGFSEASKESTASVNIVNRGQSLCTRQVSDVEASGKRDTTPRWFSPEGANDAMLADIPKD